MADIFIADPPVKTFYALAVLDRHICADPLMLLIRRLDDQLKGITAPQKKKLKKT